MHTRIFTGLVLGALCGGLGNLWIGEDRQALDWLIDNVTEPAGRIFLRLLLMIVIPLVFSSLTLAVAGMADLRAAWAVWASRRWFIRWWFPVSRW